MSGADLNRIPDLRNDNWAAPEMRLAALQRCADECYRIEGQKRRLVLAAQSMLRWVETYAEPFLSGSGERYEALQRDMAQARGAIKGAKT